MQQSVCLFICSACLFFPVGSLCLRRRMDPPDKISFELALDCDCQAKDNHLAPVWYRFKFSEVAHFSLSSHGARYAQT